MRKLDVDALVVTGRVDELLDAAREVGGVARRRFLASAVARAIPLADPGAVTEAVREQARELGVEPHVLDLGTPPAPPHAVRVPLVLSGDRGFTRMIFVRFDTGDVGLSLKASARRAVASALRLAASRLDRGADGHVLSAAQPAALARLELTGTSLGAATFVSAYSLWSERPLREGLVISAALSEEGEVLPVRSLVPKLDGVLRGCPSAKRLVVASSDEALLRGAQDFGDLELVGVRTLDELLEASVGEERPLDDAEHTLYGLRRDFDRGWARYRWPELHERLDRLAGRVPPRRADLMVPVYTMLGGLRRHLGDPEGSLTALEQAVDIAYRGESPQVPDAALTFLERHRSLTLRELGAFEQAAEAAERSVTIAEQARLRGDLIKGLGCAGLVAVGQGQLGRARGFHERAVEVVLEHDPTEASQTLSYLVDVAGRLGDLEGARSAYRHGVELDDERKRRGRRSQQSWLRTIFAGALVRSGAYEEALATLDSEHTRGAMERAPLPGLLIRRWRGRALAATGDPERGFDLLAASPSAYGAAPPPQLRFRLDVNVLWEVKLRSANGALTRDARMRGLAALKSLPRADLVRRLLERNAERVAAALRSEAPLGEELTRLLDDCDRLG